MIRAALLAALADGPMIVADLATRLGLSARVVEAGLRVLQTVNEVEAFASEGHVVMWRINPQSTGALTPEESPHDRR